MDKKGGRRECHIFPSKTLLSHSTGKLRQGTLVCLTKFRVSKNFLQEGSSTIFCRLCLTEPENFVGEPFCVAENFWYRKILWIRRGEGGSVTFFHRKFVVSQYRKTSSGNPCLFDKISGIEKNFA